MSGRVTPHALLAQDGDCATQHRHSVGAQAIEQGLSELDTLCQVAIHQQIVPRGEAGSQASQKRDYIGNFLRGRHAA